METAAVTPSRFARLGQGLRATLRLGLDTALPRLCPACRDLITDQGVCPACWSKLAFISAPYCPRLGIPFAYDPGPGIVSMQAIADPPAYQRARAAVRYDDVAAKLVHAFKYGDRLDLGPLMGRWMVRAGKERMHWSPCRCTGGGYGRAASTNPPHSRRRSRARPPFRLPMQHSAASRR